MMRKFVTGLLAGVLLTVGSAVAANSISKIGKVITNEYIVKVDGSPLEVTAIAVDGTSYAPVRVIANAAGYDVDFKSGEVLLISGLSGSNDTGSNSARMPDSEDERGVIEELHDDVPREEEAEVTETTFEGLRAVKVGDEQYFSMKDFSAKVYESLLTGDTKMVPVGKEIDYTPVLTRLAGLKADHPDMVYIIDGEKYFNTKYYQDPKEVKMRELSAEEKALLEGR